MAVRPLPEKEYTGRTRGRYMLANPVLVGDLGSGGGCTTRCEQYSCLWFRPWRKHIPALFAETFLKIGRLIHRDVTLNTQADLI